jgi:hypothetical protein
MALLHFRVESVEAAAQGFQPKGSCDGLTEVLPQSRDAFQLIGALTALPNE